MYKYCTKKMVDKAVKQGREAVIKCASDKWWFFGTCTEKQARRLGRYPDLGRNCALCAVFNRDVEDGCCDTCPLYMTQTLACVDGSLYDQADTLVDNWWDYPTTTNFKKFQAKARKLARVIGRLK